MRIEVWIRDRRTPGTLADVARRILASEKAYQEMEKNLRTMYVLEALVRNGGDQKQAAKAIGVCQHTVQRVLRSLNMTAAEVRAIARAVQESSDAKPFKHPGSPAEKRAALSGL